MREPMIDCVRDQLEQGVGRARQAGASAVRIGFSHGESTDCSFENGRLKDTGSHEGYSYSIDVVVDGRRGAASGNRLDHLDLLVDRAVALSKAGSAAHFDAYPAPAPFTPVKMHSGRLLSLTREKLIESCGEIAGRLREYNPKLFISCGADRHDSEGLLLTSGGLSYSSASTGWSLYSSVQRTEGDDILFASYGRSWNDLNEFFAPDVIADRILDDLRHAEKIVEPPRGRVKAYLPPDSAGILLMPLFLGLNGRNVAKGNSPLAGRLGRRLLAESLTITDNPHVDYSSGAAEIDGSGVPTREQSLIECGVLQRFLYDLDSAGLAGAEPTGNNGCSPYWPYIRPGSRSSRELLAGIDDGIYIKNLIGFGQGNIINGDFSCNLGLGFRIRNGEIAGRVKDTMLAGNVYELFGSNVEASSDLNHEGRLPHLVIEGLNVTGR